MLRSVVLGEPVGFDGPVYRSTNPADLSDVVAEVALASRGSILEACQAASGAQLASAELPAPARGRAIAAVGRLVEANADRLARFVTREIGKPLAEARGEVQGVVDTCDFFLGEGRRLYGQTVPSEMPDKQLFTFRNPVGTALVITAGNFPVAVPAWYLVPAVLCGNAIVWKPAEYAAASAAALYELCRDAGLPDGILNVVFADGEETYAGLAVGLTAGVVDVTADADLDLAVQGAVFSGFGTAGQRCTSLGTVLVEESVHGDLLAGHHRVMGSSD